MIRVAVLVSILFSISGCNGCDADVGGYVGNPDTHCVQHRVGPDGHVYQYILPECVPNVHQDMAQGNGDAPSYPTADLAGINWACVPPIDYDPLWVPCDMSTANPSADMATDNTPDMLGSLDDGGTSSAVDMTVPEHDGPCTSDDVDMTTLCHYPPGNPSAYHTICVGNAAVQAHLTNHPGDYLGACN